METTRCPYAGLDLRRRPVVTCGELSAARRPGGERGINLGELLGMQSSLLAEPITMARRKGVHFLERGWERLTQAPEHEAMADQRLDLCPVLLVSVLGWLELSGQSDGRAPAARARKNCGRMAGPLEAAPARKARKRMQVAGLKKAFLRGRRMLVHSRNLSARLLGTRRHSSTLTNPEPPSQARQRRRVAVICEPGVAHHQ